MCGKYIYKQGGVIGGNLKDDIKRTLFVFKEKWNIWVHLSPCQVQIVKILHC